MRRWNPGSLDFADGRPVLRAIQKRLTYANVVATLALFVALGGGSYAAFKLPRNSVSSSHIRTNAVGASEIKRNAIRSGEVKNGSLTGLDIDVSRLGKVPAARDSDNADKVDGVDAQSLRVGCPVATRLFAGACVEEAARAPAEFGLAVDTCGVAKRRLPAPDELAIAARDPQISLTSPEFTSDLIDTETVLLVSEAGSRSAVSTGTAAPFRCVATLAN